MPAKHPYSPDNRQQANEALTSPGAGSNMTYTNADGERIFPLALDFDITTDANAANRRVSIRITYATLTFEIGTAVLIQTATQTVHYHVQAGGSNAYDSTGAVCTIAIPPNVAVPYGGTLTAAIVNVQIADQITAGDIVYHYAKELA